MIDDPLTKSRRKLGVWWWPGGHKILLGKECMRMSNNVVGLVAKALLFWARVVMQAMIATYPIENNRRKLTWRAHKSVLL